MEICEQSSKLYQKKHLAYQYFLWTWCKYCKTAKLCKQETFTIFKFLMTFTSVINAANIVDIIMDEE